MSLLNDSLIIMCFMASCNHLVLLILVYSIQFIAYSDVVFFSYVFSLMYDTLLLFSSFFCPLQATPDMAVILLEIARIFATKVPGKIDADVLQLLWKVRVASILS